MSWNESKLSEIGDISTGNTPPKSNSEFYSSNDIPFIKPDNFNSERIAALNAAREHLSFAGAKRSRIASKGDILVTCIGSIGNIGIAERDVCFNQQINAIKLIDGIAHDKYVAYALLYRREILKSMANAAVVPIINKTEFSKFKIPLPPLEVQKKIAAVLEKADALRRKREEQIKRLDDLLQATFLDMFGDPVTNPKGWKQIPLGKIAESRLGKMLDRKKNNGLNTKKYLANFNVKWGEFDFSDLREMDFDPKEQEEFSLKAGDLLVCEGGEIARCAIWREELTDCYFQKALHRVRCDTNLILPEYLQKCFWFMAKNGGFNNIVSTATISHLTGVKLKQLSIPVPPVAEQKIYAQKAIKIKSINLSLDSTAEREDSLFNSLMQRAFKGELELK